METTTQQQRRLFQLIFNLSNGIQQQINSIASKYELTVTQLQLLLHIDEAERITAAQLQSLQNTSKGAISQMVDILLEKGMIERLQSNEDKRVYFIRLTEQGENVIRTINQSQGKEMAYLLSGMTHEQLSNTLLGLEKIKTNLRDNNNE